MPLLTITLAEKRLSDGNTALVYLCPCDHAQRTRLHMTRHLRAVHGCAAWAAQRRVTRAYEQSAQAARYRRETLPQHSAQASRARKGSERQREERDMRALAKEIVEESFRRWPLGQY